MPSLDDRFLQRVENFSKAFVFLEASLQTPNPSELEKTGIIQAFEFTFELGWKCLKDYLEKQLEEVNYPREVIKKAFENGLVEDGEIWVEMLEKRNFLAHTYNFENTQIAFNLIKNSYFVHFQKLHQTLQKLS